MSHQESNYLPKSLLPNRVVSRVLHCLANPHVYLHFDCGQANDRRRILIKRQFSDSSETTVMVVPWPYFEEMRSRDWIAKDDQGEWRATKCGLAMVRRMSATADAHQAQHRDMRFETIHRDGQRFPVATNAAESPLTWLRGRRGRNGQPLLTSWQYEAGERLRRDFTFGNMTPKITSSWSDAPHQPTAGTRGSAAELTDHAVAARERVRLALEAVGPELAGVLLDVCCFLKGLNEVEKNRDWPARSAKLVLQIALSRLGRHYGVAPHRNYTPKRKRDAHHAGADL